VERPESSRARRRDFIAALRAHPGVVGHGYPRDQYGPVPLREPALDAQRAHPRLPSRERELQSAIEDAYFGFIEGTTDSETMFYLALTFGLEDDPVGGVERMVGFVEERGRRHAIEDPIQMTVATTDGETIWAFRYSSEHDSRSLYFSTRMDALKALYPESTVHQGLSDETRVVVSEPLGDLPGAWQEVPESYVGIVQPGNDELRPFSPRSPS
jgi:predicted glutamine amidotransferase